MPVVLLCHCDGTNGSTTFTDVSPSAHTLGAASTTVSTTAPKFGTGSADFTSTAAALITTGNAADFNLGAAPFTLEAWAYFTSAPSAVHAVLAQFGGASDLGWFFGMVSGTLAFYYSTTGTDNPNVGAAYTPTLNTWIHLAVDRDASNVVRVYANGVVVASATVSATIFASSRFCLIGNDQNQSRAFPGRLDEVRIVTGTAMYGGAFTPPTQPFITNTTWNPADKSALITLSNGNLSVGVTSVLDSGVRSTIALTAGAKVYFETTWLTNSFGGDTSCGIATSSAVLTSMGNSAVGGFFVYPNSGIWFNGASQGIFPGTPAVGGIYCYAFDLVNSRAWVRLNNGNWNGSGTADPATNVGGVNISALFPTNAAFACVTTGQSLDPLTTTNFGASVFSFTIPSGFVRQDALALAGSTEARTTQMLVEEWGASNPGAQLTQLLLEEWVLVPSYGDMRATQVGAEQWASMIPPQMQATQAAIEQWTSTATATTQMLLTQAAIEQWSPVTSAVAAVTRQAALTVVT